MSNAHRQLQEELKRCGAQLLRTKRHHVYKLPNGKLFVAGSTPSGREHNPLLQLKRLLRS